MACLLPQRPKSGGRSSHGAAAPRPTPRTAPIAAAVAKAAAATVLRWRPVTPAASDSTVESIPGDTPEPPRPARRPGVGGGGGALPVTQPPKFLVEEGQAGGGCEGEEDPVETPSSRVRETMKAAAAQRESLACRLAFDLHPGKQRPGNEEEGEETPGGDKQNGDQQEEADVAPAGGGLVRWSAVVPPKGREGAPPSAAGSKKRKAPSAPVAGAGAAGDQQRRISAFMVERGAAGSSVAGQFESVLYKLAHSRAPGAGAAKKQHSRSRKGAGKR